MKTKALFFFVCLCALTLGFDAQAKVGDIVWQKPDNISWGEYDPYDGTFYEYDVDNNTIVAHRKDDFSRLWEIKSIGVNGTFREDSPFISISKEAIYLADRGRMGSDNSPQYVQKRSKKNGALIWERELPYGDYVFSLSATTRSVYISTMDTSSPANDPTTVICAAGTAAYKLNSENGDSIWTICGSRDYIVAYDGLDQDFVYFFDRFNEFEQFPIKRVDPDTKKIIWQSALPVKNNTCWFYGLIDDFVYNINFDSNGNLYIVGKDGKIIKINPIDGSVLAESEVIVGGETGMFYYNENIFVRTYYGPELNGTESTIFSLSASDLSENWRRGYDERRGIESDFDTHSNFGYVPFYKHIKLDRSEEYIRQYETDVPLGIEKYGSMGIFVDNTGLYEISRRYFSGYSGGYMPTCPVNEPDCTSNYLIGYTFHTPAKLCIRESDCVKNAQYVSQSHSIDGKNWTPGFPAKLDPGQDFSVSMVMKNTGNISWYKSSNLTLNFSKDQGHHNSQIAKMPILLRSEKSVYSESTQRLLRSEEYLYPDRKIDLDLAYTNPKIFYPKDEAFPRIFYPKDKTYIENPAHFSTDYVDFSGAFWDQSKSKSIGPWRSLITDIPFDNPVVDPGETVTFTQNFTAPTISGCYEFESWQMSAKRSDSVSGIEWFGDKTPKGIICVSTEPPCTPDYRCTSIPTSEKCDNTNCDKTITTKRSICYDREKCSGGDGVVSKEVCQEKNISCPNDVTEVCSCPKDSRGIFREVAP